MINFHRFIIHENYLIMFIKEFSYNLFWRRIMDNTVKIFFVAVALLYTVLGVGAFGFLQDHFITDNVGTINQANSSTNNTLNNLNEQPKTEYISSDKAINVVHKKVPYYEYTSYSTKLVNGKHPYYLVNAYDLNPNSTNYKNGIGGAKVDAKTGKLLDNGTITQI